MKRDCSKSVFLAALLAAAVAADALVEQAGHSGTHERGHDEEPQLAAGAPGGAVAEESLADGAGGVDAGVGQRDGDQVDERQREADGQAGGLGVAALVGGAEDHHQEDEGQHSLDGEGAPHTHVEVTLTGSSLEGLAVAVGGKDTCGTQAGGLIDAEQDGTGHDGADNLAHPVEQHIREFHAAVDPHAERDGGVEMGAAHMADAVGHSDHRQAEGDGHAEEAHMAEQRGTAAAQHQHEGTETFSKHFVTNLHNKIVLIG